MPLLRKLSLIITMVGILSLFLILSLSKPIEVDSPSELSKLTANQKVQTVGKVVSERALYEKTKLILLDNSIELICDDCPPYSNKTVQALGITEIYQNKTQLSVLRIKEIK